MDRDLKSTAAARRLPNAEASEADSRGQMPNYLDRESNIWRLTRLMLRVPLTASPAITAFSPVCNVAGHCALCTGCQSTSRAQFPYYRPSAGLIKYQPRDVLFIRQLYQMCNSMFLKSIYFLLNFLPFYISSCIKVAISG